MSGLQTTTSAIRSELMSHIRSRDTKPEITVRKALHHLGFRFRLCVRDLPGCPDIVLPKYRTIIQVKGCFWHRHTCPGGKLPSSNTGYWIPKLLKNCVRDLSNERKLRRLGWSVHSLWECRLRAYSQFDLESLLLKILGEKPAPSVADGFTKLH
jgi:DNA mismatch endonuclease, patch repair protein